MVFVLKATLLQRETGQAGHEILGKNRRAPLPQLLHLDFHYSSNTGGPLYGKKGFGAFE